MGGKAEAEQLRFPLPPLFRADAHPALSASLAKAKIGPDFSAIFLAKDSVSASSCSGSIRRETSPAANASSAEKRPPVKIHSLARAGPIKRGSLCVPPKPGIIPKLISGWPKDAVVDAKRRSQAKASSHPPPKA